MSDSALIITIVAVALVVVLFLFRRRLREFIFKANEQGLEARYDAMASYMDRKPNLRILCGSI